MNILFIGSLYSDAFKNKLLEAGLPDSSAGQTFESALLSGLDDCSSTKVISEYFVPCYPKFRKIIVTSEQFKHNALSEVSDESITFINFPVLKKISQILCYIKKIIDNRDNADAIVVYEATSRQLLPAALCGKKKKKVVIVPDLPEFMSDSKNPFYLIAKRFDRLLIDYALKRMDGFVLLSPQMTERLPIGNKPWMVLEGLYNKKELPLSQPKSQKKVLLYTGKIEKWFGLEDLLKAFTMIEGDNYELWLCGPGDINMVNTYASCDYRIKYKGCIPHTEVLLLQKQATILVNPRHSSDKFTLYSFPSKTMEYMASGTPTLMCKLKSLPDDYLDHLFLFDDESIEGMSKKIHECLDIRQESLNEIGEKASNFILCNKNAHAQAARLVSFVESLNIE